MSIFKPSNLSPNLEEIDVTQANTFTCQVNTAGTTVKAYKTQILSGSGNEVLYDSDASQLAKPLVNKGILKIDIPAQDPTNESSVLFDRNDYQWNVRTYEANIGSTTQPQTLVCNGYLVGSTTYVLWTEFNDNQDNLDLLKYDKYVEFKTTGSSNILPILEPNLDRLKLPGDTEEFVERKKISWVEKDLGWYNSARLEKTEADYKPITKIELDDKFTYNYKDQTEFYLYQVASDHTEKNFFVDPNDDIARSYYVVLFGPTDTITETEISTTWDGDIEGKEHPTGYDLHYIINDDNNITDQELLHSELYITATDATQIGDDYKTYFANKVNRTLKGGVDYYITAVDGKRILSLQLANSQSPIYYDPTSKNLAFVKFDADTYGTDIYVSSFKTGQETIAHTALENATNAHSSGWLPESGTIPDGLICNVRKIIGYGEDTGEIRLQQEITDERIQDTVTWDGDTSDKPHPEATGYDKYYVLDNTHALTDTELINSTIYITAENESDIKTEYISFFSGKVNRTLAGGIDYTITTTSNKKFLSIQLADSLSPIYYDPLTKKMAFVEYDEATYGTKIYVSLFSFGKSSSYIPVNGDAYLLFEKENQILSSEVQYLWKEHWNESVSPVVGGTPQAVFNLMQNRWDNDIKRLFVQPNINIKTDDTNPNELVFADTIGKPRINIVKHMGQVIGDDTDMTFDKLDDSQWLLRWPEQDYTSGETPPDVPIIPKTNYSVYTDFMDSMPNAVFYARSTPQINIGYKNTQDKEEKLSTLYINQTSLIDYFSENHHDAFYIRLKRNGSYIDPLVNVYNYVFSYENTNVGRGQINLLNSYENLYIFEGLEYELYYQDIGETEYTLIPFPLGYSPSVYNHDLVCNISEKLSSVNPQAWRDVTFISDWSSSNNVLIKFYQYYLFDYNKDLIEKSEEIYSNQMEWTFKGLQSNGDPPTIYYITLYVVDEYGKEYIEQGVFRIRYIPQQGRITLETKYDCSEQAIGVLANSPAYAASRDTSTKYTVQRINATDVYGSVNIGSDQVLNYVNVINEEETPIVIPNTFSFITGFKMPSVFIDSIEVGKELEILTVAHKNGEIDEYGNPVIDTFTLTMGSMVSYYLVDSQLVQNDNQFKLKLYKNYVAGSEQNVPLNWFPNPNDPSRNLPYFSIYKHPNADFSGATSLRSALTDNSTVLIEDTLPLGDPTWDYPRIQVFVSRNATTISGTVYQAGAYTYNSNKFIYEPYVDAEFVFLDTTSNVAAPNNTYQALQVPVASRTPGETSGIVNWPSDSAEVGFTENLNSAANVNRQLFNNRWFVFYMVIDDSNGVENEQGLAYIDINTNSERSAYHE